MSYKIRIARGLQVIGQKSAVFGCIRDVSRVLDEGGSASLRVAMGHFASFSGAAD